MVTLLFVLLVATIVGLINAAPDRHRAHPGPSWFDLQPYMRESKSRKGRAQQTRRHGSRRYGED